jgi:hypothetical protein
VKIETREQRDTTFEATPVSFPYFAENITALLALGTDAEIIQAVRSAPEIPKTLKIPNIIKGKTMVFKKI